MPIYIYEFNTFARFNKSLSRGLFNQISHIFTYCEMKYFSEKKLLQEVFDCKTREYLFHFKSIE